MGKPIYRLLILGFVVFALVFAFIFLRQSQNSNTLTNVELPTNVSAQEPTNSQGSPDGKETLTMTSTKGADSTTYNFVSDNISYTRIVNNQTVVSIPFNTWSTNDKYAFIKEAGQTQTNYWVLPMGINLTDYFNQKLPNYQLTDVTGWAADNLLIVNTNKSDGSIGPSFWFDTNTKSFIQLSTRFN